MLSEKPWKLDVMLRFIGYLFLCFALGIIVLQVIQQAGLSGKDSLGLFDFVLGTFTFHGTSMFLVFWLLRQHQMGWKEAFGFGNGPVGRHLVWAVAVGLAVLPMAWMLGHFSAMLMEYLNLEPTPQQSVQTLQKTVSLGQKISFGIIAVLIAPVVEEILFRGIMYSFIKQLGYPRVALWGTAFFFAITHANMMTFIPLTVLAIILAHLYEATDNLLTPIVTHSVFNLANYSWLISEL